MADAMTDVLTLAEMLAALLSVVKAAGRETLRFYDAPATLAKADGSPVTAAGSDAPSLNTDEASIYCTATKSPTSPATSITAFPLPYQQTYHEGELRESVGSTGSRCSPRPT